MSGDNGFAVPAVGPTSEVVCFNQKQDSNIKDGQVAQLSQTDRAAGWVSFGQKWKTGMGRQYFTYIIGLSSTTVKSLASKAIEFGEKMQNKGYYAIQGHSRSLRTA